jgi:hypothetical protein
MIVFNIAAIQFEKNQDFAFSMTVSIQISKFYKKLKLKNKIRSFHLKIRNPKSKIQNLIKLSPD